MSELRDIKLLFPGGLGGGSLSVTVLDSGLYRLEDDPLSCLFAEDEDEVKDFPNFKDEFEAEEIEPNVLRFTRIVNRSSFRHCSWLWPKGVFESDSFRTLTAEIELEGGYWLRVFGGVLIAHIPESSRYDPGERLVELLRSSKDAEHGDASDT